MGWKTWREFKKHIDRLIIEQGGDPNTIPLHHIDFNASATKLECWLGDQRNRLQVWSIPSS
jgi:hypothetical protein